VGDGTQASRLLSKHSSTKLHPQHIFLLIIKQIIKKNLKLKKNHSLFYTNESNEGGSQKVQEPREELVTGDISEATLLGQQCYSLWPWLGDTGKS
jgi:hypothetical protein